MSIEIEDKKEDNVVEFKKFEKPQEAKSVKVTMGSADFDDFITQKKATTANDDRSHIVNEEPETTQEKTVGSNSGPRNDEPDSLEFTDLIVEGFDWLASIGLSMYSGEKSDKYEISDTKKAKITRMLSKILQKYEAKMSLEMMLIATVVLVYKEKITEAYNDKKANEEKKRLENEIAELKAEIKKKSIIVESPKTTEKKEPIANNSVVDAVAEEVTDEKLKAEQEAEIAKARLEELEAKKGNGKRQYRKS